MASLVPKSVVPVYAVYLAMQILDATAGPIFQPFLRSLVVCEPGDLSSAALASMLQVAEVSQSRRSTSGGAGDPSRSFSRGLGAGEASGVGLGASAAVDAEGGGGRTEGGGRGVDSRSTETTRTRPS